MAGWLFMVFFNQDDRYTKICGGGVG